MTIMFPSQACAFTCTLKTYIAEATIQKQHVNERHLPGHYCHFR